MISLLNEYKLKKGKSAKKKRTKISCLYIYIFVTKNKFNSITYINEHVNQTHNFIKLYYCVEIRKYDEKNDIHHDTFLTTINWCL